MYNPHDSFFATECISATVFIT
uniref:Uncharacterized protein n=1 Tax=Anguilla anguilla TaxID=7936 RepID=A0A0E9T8K4_ANGAN